jgi:VWFA-related protein
MQAGYPSRSRLSRRDVLFSLASLFPAVRLWGQEPPTFSTDVKVVNIFATVHDKQGKIVRDLTKDDFILEEEGRPQTIRYFSRENNLPLTLGLLVDTSLSQRRVLGEERTASYRFLNQVLREDKDQAFVIHFDREVELLQDLTSSRQKLEAALARLEMPARERPQWGGRGSTSPGGSSGPVQGRAVGTALYDAVFLAADDMMQKQSGRKALILLTDGVDVGSKVSLTESIESAHRADLLVYSILYADPQGYQSGGRPGGGYPGGGGGMGRRRGGWGGPGMGGPGMGGPGARRPMPQHADGRKVLERLAKETGGGFFEVSSKQPLDRIYERLQEELRNQYNLGFAPDAAGAGAGFHRIQLTTKQKTLVVQAREGYYAR